MMKKQKIKPRPLASVVLEANDRLNAFCHVRIMRVEWLRKKHAKAVDDYNFANGFRAGLECALKAVGEGKDILGNSIDPDT